MRVRARRAKRLSRADHHRFTRSEATGARARARRYSPTTTATWTRFTVSDWHRQTIGEGVKSTDGKVLAEGLKLAQRYPLHCARDHWAVRAARAGTPIAVIQQQLGHSSPVLTLSKYARVQPSAADRDAWEAKATEYEAARREAK